MHYGFDDWKNINSIQMQREGITLPAKLKPMEGKK